MGEAMEYVVLARKRRPMRFSELIGQETVARALLNAVRGERTAHAYLFAGSRGVGKTSAARILTRSLNCLDPQDGEPCNACGNCLEIIQNASRDIQEIDAASNRGIDNIRELRENTKYVPAKCPYKIYIIDEVHMLTMESFNALLKTLEEPPPRVKFILATTAPQRIPETILSRCQRFDFPRIPLAAMVEYLGRVTGEEGITLSSEALHAIARNSGGSMRDALTGIDQVVAFAGNSPGDDQVLGILGVMDTREVLALLSAVLDKAPEEALRALSSIVERGHDLAALLGELLREIKDLTLYQTLAGSTSYFQDHPPATMEFFQQRKEGATPDELQQLFHLFLEAEEQLKRTESGRACVEMALIKACRVAPLVGVPELLSQVREILRHPAASAPAAPAGAGPGGATQEGPSAAEAARQAGARARGRQSKAPGGERRESQSEQESEADPGRETGTSAAETPPAQASENPRTGEPGTQTGGAPLQPAPQDTPLENSNLENTAPQDNILRSGALEKTPLENTTLKETAPEDSNNGGELAGAEPEPVRQHPPTAAASENAAGGEETGVGESAAAGEESGDSEGGEVPEDDGETGGSEDPVPCEDERWAAFVELVKAGRQRLAAELRRTEVAAITEDSVRIVAPAGAEFGSPELEFMQPLLARAFGPAFHLDLNRDSNEKARHGLSMVGREELKQERKLLAEQKEAAGDETVQRVLRFFPESRIERVQTPRERPNRSEDV